MTSPQVDVHLEPGRLHIRESQTSLGPLMEALERLLRDEMIFGLMPQQVASVGRNRKLMCWMITHLTFEKN